MYWTVGSRENLQKQEAKQKERKKYAVRNITKRHGSSYEGERQIQKGFYFIFDFSG